MKICNSFFVILIYVTILFFPIQVCAEVKEPVIKHQKAELEIRKLQLEVSKLQKESETSSTKYYVGVISGLIGLFSLLWTIYSGVKSFKQRTEELRNTTVSELIMMLSDKDNNKRLGAIRSLSKYVDQCIVQILASAEVEKSGVIRKAIEDVLTSASSESINSVLQSNSDTLPKRSYLYGRFEKINNDSDLSASVIGLSKELAVLLKKNFNEEFKHGKHFESQNSEKRALMGSFEESENLEIIAFNLVSIADITGKVIASWLKEGRIKSIPCNGVDLTDCSLYNAKMHNFFSSSCLFSNALMRHVVIDNSTITKSDFGNADLLDANLNKSDFSFSNFVKSHLRFVKANQASFKECDLSNATLSESCFRKSNLSDCKLISTKLRGVDFKYSNFQNSKLNTSEIQDSDLSYSVLDNAKFFGSKLIDVNFTCSSIRNAKFNGADLRGAVFHGADIKKCEFSGANISNADFRYTNHSKAEFSQSKGVEKALFGGSKIIRTYWNVRKFFLTKALT